MSFKSARVLRGPSLTDRLYEWERAICPKETPIEWSGSEFPPALIDFYHLAWDWAKENFPTSDRTRFMPPLHLDRELSAGNINRVCLGQADYIKRRDGGPL